MSFNKWKSTNIYGIFNNKNLTDASGNLIETCNAVFDGNVQCDYLNCITNIDTNELTCEMGITCNGYITGDALTGTSIATNSGTIDDLTSATINAFHVYTTDVSCNEIICDGDINGNIINGVTLNVTNGNFSGDVTCEDINCYDIEATNIINCNELTTNIFLCNGDIGSDYLNLYSSQTTVTSSFSGSIVCSQPFKGPAYKKVIIYCDALIGSASYTYPTAFVNSPVITSGNSSLVSSLSATAVTITTTTSISTFIIIEGF